MTLAELDLTGDLARPARLTVPDLLRWPQHQVRVSFECASSGVQHHGFTGPRLYDVLAVLLGVSIDGTPLDRAGPQLVLPQDRCGARHISGIREIRLDGGWVVGRR
ncbi:hypothetical protein [Streptomyces arenae]|uniref:hypothetical protein n=1 Tax=Streptomyces arenae TaxID=29301 RepID=UPI00265B2BDA|nr:hypothetical protein [Streptomyces arenae]MCG7209292.1 hypothetical protein [Streptomyces arenae]